MEVHQILQEFRNFGGQAAREAVLSAIVKQEEVTPHLFAILEETIQKALVLSEDPEYMGHFYALYLLGQFREARAYPLILRLFSIPGLAIEDLAVDFLTEDLGTILVSVARGDPCLIQELIENKTANVWVRVGAMKAIPTMVAAGELSREAALSYFQKLFREKLERRPLEDVRILWTVLVSCAAHLYPEEIYKEIENAYAEKLVEKGFLSLTDVDDVMRKGKEAVLEELPELYPVLMDAMESLSEWGCFDDAIEEPEDNPFPEDPVLESILEELEDSPIGADLLDDAPVSRSSTIRSPPKIGRNDPCPCGSGKKHKKCCGKR